MRKRRTRLRLAYSVGLLLFGHPSLEGWVAGALLIALGAFVHAWAAGNLDKNRKLSLGGPYRHVRNPFYAADALRDLGLLLACHTGLEPAHAPIWALAGLYFAAMFGWVIRRRVLEKEEPALAEQFGAAYARYRAAVPRFVPRLRPASHPGDAPAGGFSLAKLGRNRELPRLVTSLLLIGVTFYREEAMRKGFVLARVLETSWEPILLGSIPAVLLATRVRLLTSREPLARAVATLAPGLLAAWAGLLVVVQSPGHGSELLAWGLGIALFVAGMALRLAAKSAPDGPGASRGPYAVVRHPALLGTGSVMLAIAASSQAWFLAVPTLCLCIVVFAAVARTEESALATRPHARRPGEGVPRWWPGWSGLRALGRSVVEALRGRSPLSFGWELAVFGVLAPTLLLELVGS